MSRRILSQAMEFFSFPQKFDIFTEFREILQTLRIHWRSVQSLTWWRNFITEN